MSSLAFSLAVQGEAFSRAALTCSATGLASCGRCSVSSALRTSASVSGKSLCGGRFCDIVLILFPAHSCGAGLKFAETEICLSGWRNVEAGSGRVRRSQALRTSHQLCKATDKYPNLLLTSIVCRRRYPRWTGSQRAQYCSSAQIRFTGGLMKKHCFVLLALTLVFAF